MENKSIHITLVGGQLLPVYLGIKAANPDKIIFVFSSQTYSEMLRMEKIIKDEQPNVEIEQRMFEPVEIGDILKSASLLFDSVTDKDNVSVNLTSGTKPWSIILFSLFQPREEVSLIYIDQNCKQWDLRTGKWNQLEFDMDKVFELNDNPLENYTPFSDFSEKDIEAIQDIRKLRKHDYSEFNALTIPTKKSNEQIKRRIGEYKTDNGSSIKWNKETDEFSIKIINKKGVEKTQEWISPNIKQIVLNAFWFELEVASMLSEWQQAKDIRMNCMFPYQNKSLKNEIDIIVNTGNKILFVECKTQITSNIDIDKFSSAIKNYAGTGNKGILITDAIMTPETKEKCRDNNILFFSIKECETEQLDPPQELYQLLDEELLNINHR